MPNHSSIARLQQVLTVWTLACAVAWVWVGWSMSREVAALGGLAIAWGHSVILGAEFLLLCRVRRSDPAPRATARQLLAAWWAESCHAIAVFAWRQPFRWRAVPDRLAGERVAGRHGIVFVHGFVCNRGFWAPWRTRLEPEGRAHLSVNLEPGFVSIDAYVGQLEQAVRQVREVTGLPPVLVCHSMGGLVARAWLRQCGDPHAVAHVVTIGSPHGGTWLARFSHMPSGRQMRPGSAWLQDLAQAWSPQLGERFTCWWSNCDNIVMPPSTATLPAADNRFVPGAAHVQLAFRPEAVEGTLARVEALDHA